MDIVFAGSSDFAVEILKSLNANYNILCVITQPDKPVGRKKILTPCPVKVYAKENNLNIYQPIKINSQESLDYITNFKPDFFVVAAYGQKIGKTLLDWSTPINVHGSLLPDLRGAAPIQYSIINGLTETGITTMLMDEGMDTGDMLLKSVCPIDINDNFETLSSKLAILGSDLIIETLNNFHSIFPIKQDESKATKTWTIKKEETIIDFSKSAIEVHNLIRGLSPKPNGICYLNGKVLKILLSEFIENESSHTSGEILSITKEGIELGCTKGSLIIKELQPEGKKAMKAYDFAQGSHLKIGNIIE